MNDTPAGSAPKKGRRKRFDILPMVPLRDNVVFPVQIAPLAAARVRSVGSLEMAVGNDSRVVLGIQRDPENEDIRLESLYPVAVIAAVGAFRRIPGGAAQALVEGQQRVIIRSVEPMEDHWRAKVELLDEKVPDAPDVEALAGSIKGLYAEYVAAGGVTAPDAAIALARETHPGVISDIVSASPELSLEDKIALLQEQTMGTRLTMLLPLFARLFEVAKLRSKITEDVQRTMTNTQREHILREQLQALRKELAEISGERSDDELDLSDRVSGLDLPESVRARLEKEIHRLEQIPTMSPEVSIVRTWVEWILDLPWKKTGLPHIDLSRAGQILDEDHYGLDKVKERILEWLAVQDRMAKVRAVDPTAPRPKTPILCFVGPPGVGKTSLGRSIARALDRKFVRMSLGGVHDEAEIRGHRRTYIGALPGRIIQAMKQAGTTNPVIMLDEIDKVGRDFRGDPEAALLEVLDPEQNFEFSDHYLEIPYDLSDAMFITTANVIDTISPPLRDRMEVIRISGYTEEEKLEIARRHLIPKQRAQHGLSPREFKLDDDAILGIVEGYTYEAGVRQLDRSIAQIARKVPRLLNEGKKSVSVKRSSLPALLGPARHAREESHGEDEVGTVTGVVVSDVGGDIVTIETLAIEGPPSLVVTGQIGQVMEESAKTALSWAKAHGGAYGVEKGYFDHHWFHIHVPAAAVPKDGPSAGVTILTALISAASSRKVRHDVAMTGEVTLRGTVLPIGGVKDKVLAARRSGIAMFILPKKNLPDLSEIDRELLGGMEIRPVERIEEVLDLALLGSEPRKAARHVGFNLPSQTGVISS